MKIWKRYIIFGIFTVILTSLVTFILYRHVKLKYGYKSRFHDNLDEILAFNSNSVAIFYHLYERSPLYEHLKNLDRKTVSSEEVRNFMDLPESITNHRKHVINVALSDLLPLNRPVPDSRPSGYESFSFFTFVIL